MTRRRRNAPRSIGPSRATWPTWRTRTQRGFARISRSSRRDDSNTTSLRAGGQNVAAATSQNQVQPAVRSRPFPISPSEEVPCPISSTPSSGSPGSSPFLAADGTASAAKPLMSTRITRPTSGCSTTRQVTAAPTPDVRSTRRSNGKRCGRGQPQRVGASAQLRSAGRFTPHARAIREPRPKTPRQGRRTKVKGGPRDRKRALHRPSPRNRLVSGAEHPP